MKKHILSIQAFTLMIVLLLAGNMASAQTQKESDSFIKTAVVKHTSTHDKKSYIHIKLNNEQAEKFTLTFKDGRGTLLYREVFQDVKFDKRFQFEDLNEQGTITIIVKEAKGNASQTFEVNPVTRVVNDVVIHRL